MDLPPRTATLGAPLLCTYRRRRPKLLLLLLQERKSRSFLFLEIGDDEQYEIVLEHAKPRAGTA